MDAEGVVSLVQKYASVERRIAPETEMRRKLHIDGDTAEEMLLILVKESGVSLEISTSASIFTGNHSFTS